MYKQVYVYASFPGFLTIFHALCFDNRPQWFAQKRITSGVT